MPSRARAALVLALLALLAVASLWAALATGSLSIGAADVLGALLGQEAAGVDVVLQLRLPRALAGFACGGLLALAGALMQVLLRNPLADPYVLGISSGAGVGALLAILMGLSAAGINGLAFAGALGAMLLVFGLARGDGTFVKQAVAQAPRQEGAAASFAAAGVLPIAPSSGDAERLRALLGDMDGVEVVAEAGDGQQALHACAEHLPDLLLLDIAMPGIDGLETARHLAAFEPRPAVVFCTAYDVHALSAFEAEAIDYLVKPVRPEALAAALKKAERPNRVQLAALTRPAAGGNGAGPRSHISARTRKGIELIPLEQVIFFIADHKYVTLRHEGGEVLLDEPLKALEDEFGERFVRIHRNALVARERIERLQRTPLGHFQLYLKGLGPDALTVSRRHVAGVRKLMHSL